MSQNVLNVMSRSAMFGHPRRGVLQMDRNLAKPGDLEYHDHICIRWKLNLALNFVSSESQSVCFRNSELTLRLILPSTSPLLFMQMKSNSVIEGVYEVEAFLSDKNNSKVHRKTKFLTFSEPYYGEIWSIERDLIFSNLDDLVTNGVLNFVCIINYTTHRCQGDQKPDASQQADPSLEKLSLDVSKLYKSTEQSDVLLKCDDRTIPAHKFLLSARSDVFAAMFRNDMLECREGVINIQDIELPILEHLLKYMYSGKIDEVSPDTAVELYRAADKYDVCTLKQKCSSILTIGLTDDNACDILLLADSHSDEDLKKNVLMFLLKNDGFLLLSDQWHEFSKAKPGLAVEAYDAFVRHKSHK